MHIVVIGAGIGGLSAAISLNQDSHSVTILETAEGLTEFGAGIQLSPNAIRVLDHWGLKKALAQVAFAPTKTFARRYDSGRVLGRIEQNPEYEAAYGAP
jgi:salicylate hydroxylase